MLSWEQKLLLRLDDKAPAAKRSTFNAHVKSQFNVQCKKGGDEFLKSRIIIIVKKLN
jgi:hypothetical protein